jgi:hypothetical protein
MEHKNFKFNVRVPWPSFRLCRSNLRRLLPTPSNVIFTLAMIALLVAAQTAGALPLARTQPAPAAASTGTIAYQGRLADAAGVPLTGTYNMIFRLYDAATGGTPLWSEPWTGSNGVKVSDGLFNVMLGSLSQLPISQFTNSSSLFLGITVGTDDEMAPRVQLGSVPFAVQALTVPDGSVTPSKLDRGYLPASGGQLAGDLQVKGHAAVTSDGSGECCSNGQYTLALSEATINTQRKAQLQFHNDGSAEGYIRLEGQSPRWFAFGSYQTPMGGKFSGDLYTDGSFAARGAKSAVVQTKTYGQRKLYAVEAPDVRFSDEGMARLQEGTARVDLDPIFLETIEGEYLVHVTPYGDASLHVAEIGENYFVIKARAGDPDVAFAWRLSATRKGYAGVRLEAVKGLDREAAK